MAITNVVAGSGGKDLFGSGDMQFIDAGPGQWRLIARSPVWRPPTDVFETDEAVVVRVEIAGMRDEDFNIELDGRQLSIRGSRPDAASRRAYHLLEIRYGEFSIDLELPVQVTANQVEAVYQNGFLQVTLPKSRPVQIEVEEQG